MAQGFAGFGARSFVKRVLQSTQLPSQVIVVDDVGEFASPWVVEGDVINVRVYDLGVYPRLVVGASTALGETYVEGLWETTDLQGLLNVLITGVRKSAYLTRAYDTITAPLDLLRATIREYSARTQKIENLSAHYDLPPSVFEKLLDPQLFYSSAIWNGPTDALASAQINKYEKLGSWLRIGDSRSLLDLGSGWGSFTANAARAHPNLAITAITAAHEQAVYTAHRLEPLGVQNVNLIEGEASKVLQRSPDTFDAILLLESIEHCPLTERAKLLRLLRRRIRTQGRLVLQFSSIPSPRVFRVHRRQNFIKKHIFPGGELVGVSTLWRQLEGAGFAVMKVDDITEDFRLTISAWQSNFETLRSELEQLEPSLGRAWEFYLAICQAVFATRLATAHQVLAIAT